MSALHQRLSVQGVLSIETETSVRIPLLLVEEYGDDCDVVPHPSSPVSPAERCPWSPAGLLCAR